MVLYAPGARFFAFLLSMLDRLVFGKGSTAYGKIVVVVQLFLHNYPAARGEREEVEQVAVVERECVKAVK